MCILYLHRKNKVTKMLRKKRYIKITLQITSNMFYGFVSHESIKLRTILQKKNDIYFGNFFVEILVILVAFIFGC